MSDHIEKAAFNAADGAGWTGLGVALDPSIANDVGAIVKAIGLDWTVQARQAYYKDADGKFVAIKNASAQVRSDTGKALSLTSTNSYHTTNRQPADVIEAFRDDFAKQSLVMTHAASLLGGQLIVCAAVMPADFDIVIGKGDRLQSFVTLSTGYDKKHGTKATKGTIRVVCWNTLMASIDEGQRNKQIKTVKASTELEYDSLKTLIANVKELQKVEAYRYDALANAAMSEVDVAKYFADVLEVNIADLGKVDVNGNKIISSKTENMLTALKTAYINGRGASVAHGTAWGALNAVTHYATHDKTVRDMHDEGKASARVASNLFGDAARLKARALQLALSNQKIAIAA